MTNSEILEFQGEYRWLSNFWPVTITYGPDEGCRPGTLLTYRSVEHAYQAAKTHDAFAKVTISKALTAGQAKRLGGPKAKGGIVGVRPDWETVKFGIMMDLLREKFRQSPYKEKLLATGEMFLCEGNTWHDLIWGCCKCAKHNWSGKNALGELIMKVRMELQNETSTN